MDERNGSGNGGGNGRDGGHDHGDDADFGPEEPTKAESQSGAIRAEAKLYGAVCDPLDLATDALGNIEDSLERVASTRRRPFLRSVIQRLRRMGDAFHESARDFEALERLYAAEEAKEDDE
jgi:hypothetical protein